LFKNYKRNNINKTHFHINDICRYNNIYILRRLLFACDNNLINRQDCTKTNQLLLLFMRYLRDDSTKIYENYSQLLDFSRIYAGPHCRIPRSIAPSIPLFRFRHVQITIHDKVKR